MKFKKSISLALVMCMVLSLFASFVVSAEEAAEENVVEVNVNENAMLTDGVTGFTEGWEGVGNTKVALINNKKCTTQAMDVVVSYDLGEVKAINALALDFYHDANVMIGYPEGQVLVEASVDGESWAKVGLFDIAEAEVAVGTPNTVSTVCEFNAIKAKHIRATFEVGSSTGVLGESPADGKVFWEFCSIAEVTVTEANLVEVNVSDYAQLTDGETGFTEGWKGVGNTKVALINNALCKTNDMDVVVTYDLGEVKAINSLVLDFYHCADVMIGYPQGKILVEVSVDGEAWSVVGLYDIAEAEVALGAPGTVSTVCEFAGRKAQYVRATFEVGASTGVLGESPADGKVFWEFCSIAEISVTNATVDSPIVTAFNVAGYLDSNDAYIYTDSAIYAATSFAWWRHVGLAPVEGKEGVYEVTEIIGGSGGAGKPVAIPEGGFAWTAWEWPAAGSDGANALAVMNSVAVGDYVQFTGLDIANLTAAVDASAAKYVDPNAPVNIALDKEYTLSGCGNRDSYYAKLTDGIAAATLTYNATDWFGFYHNDGASDINAPDKVGTVVIDLEEVYDLSSVRVNTFFGNTSGITNPTSVVLKVSEDGETFTEVETKTYEVTDEQSVSWITFDLSDVTARYVSLDFTLSNIFVFINEIEVYNVPVVVEEVPEGATALEHIGYIHAAHFQIMYAEEDMTFGDLVTKYFGQMKDLNYCKVIVCNEDGEIVYVDVTLGRDENNIGKQNATISAGQYLIALNANKEGHAVLDTVKVGDIVTLYNVNIDDLKAATETTTLTNAAFTVEAAPALEEVEGGDLPAHNPRVHGALPVPANTAISYTVAFENGANFSLYDETISVLVNGEALEFGMLGYATALAKGDVLTIVNEGAEAVELYPSVSEIIFGTMGNPIVLEDLGDIVANVTEAIISDSGAAHYEYTATVNGTLTITMPEGNWTYTVNNLTTFVYGDSQWSDSDPVLSTYTIDVAEGDLIQIVVGTYDPENPWGAPAGEIAFNVVEEATPVAPEDSKEIVDDAFALESGAELPYAATLTGKIVKINTPYSEQYGNISVTIEVEGTDGVKALLCYRIKGEGADTLAVGDTITVTGTIINYNGTIEYAAGSTIDAIEKGEGEVPVAPEDPKEIVDAAFGLEEGAALPYNATLTGVIVSVDTEYSESYKNVTVSIEVEGTDGLHVIQCFRLKGEGADVIGVGDTITVTGVIKNYYGKIEFDSGCTLDSYVEYVPEYNEVVIDVNENAILTDGKTGFTGNWGEVGNTDVLLIANGECKNMAMQVVLNYALGETKTINGLVLDFYHCAGVMIGYPEGQILVEVSVDGENWTKVGLFDLAAAELATTAYGTVVTTCEFDAVEAAYVKATFVVGSSTGVLGDSPADGKVFWEFASLAEVAVNEVKNTVTGNFAEEGLNSVNQFAVNAHNIWVGDASSIEWWTKALLQWNEEANGWEVLKVQGNGKVDWVTEGNQIVIAAHADNGAAVASIAALQVGDIVYIWDIGVATSDKLVADADCNGGFYTTDATKVGTTAFTYKEKVALAGDVNMDGEINEADYIIIRKLVVGTADAADYTAEQLKLADVNGNGVIDANDYLVVKRHALGTYVIPAWR